MVGQTQKHLGFVNQFLIIRAVLQPLRVPILNLFVVTVIGVAGYMIIDRYNFSDALYMAIITEATIGFGEIHPLSPEGRYFTIFLILISFVVFAFAITSITSFILSGEYKRSILHQKQLKLMQTLRGHTIICGFGRAGRKAMEELKKQNIPFVVIEKETNLHPESEANFIVGDATLDEILISAGIRFASNMIIAIPSDSDNLMIVVSAHALNPNLNIVARVSNKSNEDKMKNAGARHIISPDAVGGIAMARMISKPDLMEFMDRMTNVDIDDISIDEITYHEQTGNKLCVKDLNDEKLAGCHIIGYKTENGEFIINPSHDVLIRNKTKLFVIGNKEQIRKLHSNFS